MPMTSDDITLRSPARDEMRAFMQPIADAFSDELSQPEFEAERQLLEPERCVSAFDGEERVASSAAYTFRLTVPGGEVGAAGITGVGVRPDHRRRGILRRMMTWLHDDALRRGEPVAILGASEAAIYQRFGYGQGTTQSTFTTDPARIWFREPVPPDPSRRIRMVDADEAARIYPAVYDAARGAIPGAIDRSDLKWRLNIVGDADWMRHGGGPKYRAVLEVDGEPRGFAIYRVKGDWGPTGPASTLRVLEVLGLDAVAEQVLWEWLFEMDLMGTITAWRCQVPNPLQQWLLEPRRLSLTVSDGMWLRILDVPAALSARTYAGSGTLVLDVEDPLIESNAGRWQITVEGGSGGSATVTRTKAAPDLELDVAALASAYLGAYRFGDLARAGRVRECQPGALQTADVLFTPSRAPWASTPF
jgi:predicted acetyltransferase